MGSFKKVDIKEYVKSIPSDQRVDITAQKSGCVSARKVVTPGGEDLVTYTSDGNKETVNHVNEGDYILTSVDRETGKPVVDANGRTNSWGVGEATLRKKYDFSHPDVNGNFVPSGGEQKFTRLPEDVSFTAPWGEDMNIKAGGYANVTDPNDVYGIARAEFYQTYDVHDVSSGIGSAALAADAKEFKDSFKYVSPETLDKIVNAPQNDSAVKSSREVPFEEAAVGVEVTGPDR